MDERLESCIQSVNSAEIMREQVSLRGSKLVFV